MHSTLTSGERGIPAKGEVVDVGKEGHEDLAVKAVHNPSMTRNDVIKVLHRQPHHHTLSPPLDTYLDLEGPLKARGKKASKRSQKRSEDGEREGVKSDRIQGNKEATNLQKEPPHTVHTVTIILCMRFTLYS